ERRKEGASTELAVSLGVLTATSQAPAGRLAGAAALGEVALDGALRGVRGTLALAEALWRSGTRTLLCAAAASPEAAVLEALTVTRLHSAAGTRPPGRGLMRRRPYRSPHHTLSRAGLIGGGSPPRPGEISLAHHGVLFLDELSEYPRGHLDALREPLERGEVTIVRAAGCASFPARALLVGAMNPCACGW